MEQRGAVGFVRIGGCKMRSQFRRRHQTDIVAPEVKPHQAIRGVIEDGTDGTDKNDELCYISHVPRFRFDDLARTDVVGRNRHLGKVVEQIVGKDLDGQHRHEWKPGACTDHAEHVAEVGACAHANVFQNVHEHLAAFEHAFFEHHQVFLQQNHVGRFLGDVHRVVHGNANVRGAQRGGIIDAVAHKADDMALLLKRLHDAFFVCGRKAGEHVHCFDRFSEIRVVHRFDLAAKQDFFGVNADFTANFASDQIVVAGQNFHRDTMLAQGLDGFGCGVLGWIEKGEIAGQHEVTLVGLAETRLGAEFFGRDRQHTETVLAQFVDLLDKVAGKNRFHRENLALALEAGAPGKDSFGRAFGEQLTLAIRPFHRHGHHAAGKVERDFIHHFVFIDRKLLVQFLVFERGTVEHILQAGLKMADEIGVAQDGIAFVFEDVAMELKDDVVDGQRAGLIGAQHIHRTEVLDGVEFFDDNLLFRHGESAFGEADRNNHRQHFRREADGDSHGEQKRLLPIVLEHSIDDENHRYHDHHERDHQPHKMLYTTIEGGDDLRAGEALGHLAEIGLRAGRDDDRGSRAAFHAGTEEA